MTALNVLAAYVIAFFRPRDAAGDRLHPHSYTMHTLIALDLYECRLVLHTVDLSFSPKHDSPFGFRGFGVLAFAIAIPPKRLAKWS